MSCQIEDRNVQILSGEDRIEEGSQPNSASTDEANPEVQNNPATANDSFEPAGERLDPRGRNELSEETLPLIGAEGVENNRLPSADAGAVQPQVASRLKIYGPLETQLGSALRQITVSIDDELGSRVTSAKTMVTLALLNNPEGAVLTGVLSAETLDGVAVFGAVQLDQIGVGYTLSATAAGLTSAVSQTFDIVSPDFERLSLGLTEPQMGAVVTDPSSPGTILVGGAEGIYRSTDGGTNWSLSAVVTDLVTALAFNPNDSSIVYACTRSTLFYRSTDGGESFGPPTQIDPGALDPRSCNDIAFSENTLWVAILSGGGIRRSGDEGETWAGTALGSSSYSVAASPDGQTLYASTRDGTFRSTDGGTDWSEMTNDFAFSVETNPLSASTVYMGLACGSGGSGPDRPESIGGFRRSTDSGLSWGPIVGGGCIVQILSLPGSSLFAVDSGGRSIYTSSDQGQTWLFGSPVFEGNAAGIAASADGLTIYVPTVQGLFKSATGGQ